MFDLSSTSELEEGEIQPVVSMCDLSLNLTTCPSQTSSSPIQPFPLPTLTHPHLLLRPSFATFLRASLPIQTSANLLPINEPSTYLASPSPSTITILLPLLTCQPPIILRRYPIPIPTYPSSRTTIYPYGPYASSPFLRSITPSSLPILHP